MNYMKYNFELARFLELCYLILHPIQDNVLFVYNEIKRHGNWRGCGIVSGSYWNGVKIGSKKRDFKIEISIEDAWLKFLKQNGKCALTGLSLNEKNFSLDRIDSREHYTIDNVQWLHKDVNHMKWDLSEKELRKWCKLICAYQF